jgi:hypothetical protein
VFEPAVIRDKVFGQTSKGTTMGGIVYGGVYPEDPGIAHIPKADASPPASPCILSVYQTAGVAA